MYSSLNGENDMLYSLPLPHSEKNRKTGAMKFDDGTTCPCSITSISTHGITISLWRARELPHEFWLSIDDRAWRVRLVWRTGLHNGVQFIDTAIHPTTCGFPSSATPHEALVKHRKKLSIARR